MMERRHDDDIAIGPQFRDWLAGELGDDLVKDDLREKHEKMRSGDFVFLRATYWRWCEIIPDICPELTDAPEVLAIGDTHLENFGTGAISRAGSSGASMTSTTRQ